MTTVSSEVKDSKCNNEWDGHKVIELLKKLSLKQCNEYLMNRYIKENSTKLQYSIYPYVLQQLSLKYLGDIFFRFKSISHQRPIQLTSDNHHAIVLDVNSSFYNHQTLLIDLPIPISDNNLKLKWRLKINSPQLPNGHYFIGIVSDDLTNFDETIWEKYFTATNFTVATNHKFENIYGVFGGSTCWREENSSTFAVHSVEEKKGEFYEIKDTLINDEYDTNECSLTIVYDGKLKQLTIKNDKRKTIIACLTVRATNNATYWYPAISLRDVGDTVQIVG